MSNTLTIFFYLFSATFILVFIELIYSLYKKDDNYSIYGTLANTFNGLILNIISKKIKFFYLGYFIITYSFIYTNKNVNFNIVSFIVTFILVDFMYYIFHMLHHRFSFFWMFHHVHHGDDKLNLSTAHRISWVEEIYLFLFFSPIILIGIHPFMLLISFYTLSLYQFLCHSAYIKFPSFLSIIFITPELHKIHHDQVLKNQNSNFGGILNIWDRIFGTYINKIDSFTPGIKGYHQNNLIKIYTDPIISFIKK